MPYPPQPYPPLARPAPVGCVAMHQARLPSPGLAEPEDTVPETITINDADNTPCDATFVAESAKEDTSVQARSLAVAQYTSDFITEDLNWCFSSPGVDKDAYSRSSVSLDLTAVPLTLVDNDRASSDVSALDSPMDIQHDSATAHGEVKMGSGCGFDTSPHTIMEAISQLFFTVAFAHLSCPRHASPLVASDDACYQAHHTSSPVQIDLSAPRADDSSNEPNPSSLFTEPMSVSFVHPGSPLPPSSPGFINDYSMECSDDAPIPPSFPLSSSPVPSSSPSNFFTSSPTRYTPYTSPPTSPVPTQQFTAVPLTAYTNPLKRPYNSDTVATSTEDQDEGFGEEPAKKKKLNTHDPPQPKRSTHLSQHREYVKLKTPFRSPVTVATKDCPRYKDSSQSSEPDLPSLSIPFTQNNGTVNWSSSHEPRKDFMARVRTPRASGQFKSPLSAVAASGVGSRRLAVSASPNVQALQLRLQTLKRAVKIRNDGEGEKLERLAKKWTDVAREVAWEVWSVVKDNVQDVSKLGGGRGTFQNNWGWADKDKEGEVAGAERPSREDEVLSEEDEPPVAEDTMSVMLRKMGIDPATLGWDEGEERIRPLMQLLSMESRRFPQAKHPFEREGEQPCETLTEFSFPNLDRSTFP
ncbi:hypothetical protein BDM02DRAFT_1413097 [Thelephora ganbajun]|uniref:Uncharacterized protein n=1 Tax=Thelephora ganbajun TaxID=370292 RepID=A0ACB6Z1G7_THEGA|nr:hypothetical protein BDM02DRAFT_1413097 [Thelephora ganbajun]